MSTNCKWINKMWYIYIYTHIYICIYININRVLCPQSLSHVQLCVTPWTAVCQAVHSWDSSGKNTGVGCYSFSGGFSQPRDKAWVSLSHLRTFNNEILLSHNMSEIMPFAATWMNPEIIILNKLSQMEKDKYCMISLVCEI